MSSPSHFLLRAGRVFCIPTRVGHPELINLFIGRGVLVQICENSFTNYSSLLWRAVSGLWPAGKLHITKGNPQMSLEIFLLNPSGCSVVWLSPSARSINFMSFFTCIFSSSIHWHDFSIPRIAHHCNIGKPDEIYCQTNRKRDTHPNDDHDVISYFLLFITFFFLPLSPLSHFVLQFSSVCTHPAKAGGVPVHFNLWCLRKGNVAPLVMT